MRKKTITKIEYIFDEKETESILRILKVYNHKVAYVDKEFADLERSIRRA